jgi:DNA/RNA endonuclease YhcR with UshA esterase domain
VSKTKQIGFLPAAAVTLGLMAATAPAFAHHSFAAEYDAKKPVTLTGVVTKVQWTNPHARFDISVKDESGGMTTWEFELGSPNGLMRRGWSRSSLKPGDTVTVTGYLAKDGSKLANARSVSLADGRKIFAGSSDDGGPAQ